MRWRAPSNGLSGPIAGCATRVSVSSTRCAASDSNLSGSAPMRYILRRREIVADDWQHLGEESVAEGCPLIIPLAQLRQEALRWRQWPGALGVRLAPQDAPEDLTAELPGLDLVAVEFPNS